MSHSEQSARRAIASNAVLFDEGAVTRAEQALQSFSDQFQGWLDEEVLKVHQARTAAATQAWSDASLNTLLNAAHDLKGLGATYAYPLATMIAASLCRLIDTDEGKAAARARPALIHAHVDAIRAAARDQIKSDAHPIGRALLQALEAKVTALGVGPAA